MIREKIRYAMTCLLLGVLAVLYDEYITSVLFLVAVLFPIVLWGLMQYVKRNVEIELSVPAQIVKKHNPFQIEIHLRNKTIIPILKMQIRLAYQNQYTKQIQRENVYVTLNGQSKQSIEAEMKSEYCGNLNLRIEKTMLYDFLGLFRFKKKGGKTFVITVLPKQYALENKFVPDNPHVMVEGDLYSDKKAGDDPSEIFGIREYRYGDRMNRIHWKLTQKEGSLMVKELGFPINCAILILIELPFKEEMETVLKEMDLICSCVFALSNAFIEDGISHYIAWYDQDAGCMRHNKVEKEEELYEMMAMLFDTRVSPKEQNAPASHYAEYSSEQYTSIYYITAGLTEEKADSLMALAKNAWCHIINTGIPKEEILRYLECLPVTMAQVTEENLDEDILKMMPQQEEGISL
ncbi:MAG: DUF58 domain-containing protein [Lachnospiraceae bacterium]|nr:DUF58 domain-containing protein [Lachnospiraceae bacterium]